MLVDMAVLELIALMVDPLDIVDIVLIVDLALMVDMVDEPDIVLLALMVLMVPLMVLIVDEPLMVDLSTRLCRRRRCPPRTLSAEAKERTRSPRRAIKKGVFMLVSWFSAAKVE